MSVAFDAKMTAGNGAGGTFAQAAAASSISSNGMTIGAGATCLVAGLCIQAIATAVSMTWNGVTITPRGIVTDSNVHDETSAIFVLPLPATGNRTLAGAWTGAGDAYMWCVSFSGTDTITGVKVADNTSATRTTSLAVNTDPTGATVVGFTGDSAAPATNQTQIFSAAPLGPSGAASYAIGGSGTNSHTFTGGGDATEALVGVHVIAAATSVPPVGGFINPVLLWKKPLIWVPPGYGGILTRERSIP